MIGRIYKTGRTVGLKIGIINGKATRGYWKLRAFNHDLSSERITLKECWGWQ
jgi:hypothetical protein